jgi:hypothetical protein
MFQLVKENNFFRQTIYSGNFAARSTKNVRFIYFSILNFRNIFVNGKQNGVDVANNDG